MAKDMQDTVRDVLNQVIEGAGKNLADHRPGRSGGSLSGMRGIAAGAGAVALAPVAAKGIGKLVKTVGGNGLEGVAGAPGRAASGLASKVGDTISSGVGDKLSEKVDDAGGPAGVFSSAVKSALPFGGDDDDSDEGDAHKKGVPGVGKGRRMPVQQTVDIGAPIETVYNQWTQFELWPNFMHRVTRVTHEDDCTISFATKIWGKTKEFRAQIETQRPDERIKWRVTDGLTHTGVVTFHELGPRLTRVMLGLDVEPGGMLEKAARGLRHVKRAARADLHRFKAFIEMQETETGAWRGVIEDGELAQEHDSGYDKGRKYSDFEEAFEDSDSGDDSKSRGGSSGRRSSGGSSRSGGSGSSRGSKASSSRGSSASGSRGSNAGSGRSSSRSGGSRARSSRSGSTGASSGDHSGGRSRSRGRS